MTKNNFWTYEKISGPHIKLLRLTALLPFEGKTFNYIGTQLLSVYWNIIILIYNTMFFGYGVRMATGKRFEIDYVSEQFVVENISFRYVLFFLKRKSFMKLVETLKDLWSFIMPNESQIVRVYERMAYYFWNVILINVFIIVTTFIITAQFIRIPPNIINGTDLRMLPFRFYVNIQQEPYFTIVSIFQGIVTYSIVVIDTGIETAQLYLVLIVCGYLRSLRVRLLTLMESQDKINQKNRENLNDMSEIVYKDVRMCVIFHQKLMLYCEEIERFMRSIYFVGIFTTIYNISMLGLSLMKSKEQSVKYIALLVLNIFQFFTCQWSPEYLLTESGAIAQAAYFSSLKQVGQQRKTNVALQFLILRSQKPIQLTAGGYLKLSMETFGSMVKNAFSFYALLRNFNV